MAWIKIETALPRKPEVLKLSDILGRSCQTIVGHLVEFWSWADENSANGRDLHITEKHVDRVLNWEGFASALRQVGWLAGTPDDVEIPNFERHNGVSAKIRSLEAEAKRLRRMSDKTSDKCPTKEAGFVGPEERRKEKNINPPKPPLRGGAPGAARRGPKRYGTPKP